MQHLYILTGASRGMGLAMAHALLARDHQIVCISRQRNTALADAAKAKGVQVQQWTLDLADAAVVGQTLHHHLGTIGHAGLGSATLINNAGVIPTIAPLSGCAGDEVAHALRVGLEAPMLLTQAFLHSTSVWLQAGWRGPRKVLNISSGLGRRPMASQAAYCAAKAGLDHFSRCVALEEAQSPHGVRIVSLAPGVIDTDMQTQLRAADAAQFPDRQRFLDLQAQGQLSSSIDAAQRVLRYLQQADFGQTVVDDVRD